MNIIRGGVIGLAGVVGAGVLAWPAATAFADTEDFYKRDERSVELYAVDDDDLDDTNDRTGSGDTQDGTGAADGTGDSRSRADGTRSNVTGVSRDRDRSRGDKTKDFTRDGGDRTRDRTGGLTNDRSRNDSRRAR